jgi:hypothetical protein
LGWLSAVKVVALPAWLRSGIATGNTYDSFSAISTSIGFRENSRISPKGDDPLIANRASFAAVMPRATRPNDAVLHVRRVEAAIASAIMREKMNATRLLPFLMPS